MIRSESILHLTQALGKFHATIGRISKDAKNPFFKSNYASLPHILQEIADPMISAGLFITHLAGVDGLKTLIVHAETGEHFGDTYPIQAVRQNDPQAQASAISYARRYAVTSLLSLQISDDDGEAAMKQVRQPQAPAKVAPTEQQFAGIVQYMNGTEDQRKQAILALKKYTLTQEQKDTIQGL